MSLLTPSFGLLFWMVISFAVVFLVLAKYGFPVITKSVNERRDYIRESLAKADEANRLLADIKHQSDVILEDARKRQAEILRQATSEADRIIRKAKDDATAQGKQKLEEALRSIELQKQKAIGEIRAQVAVLSVDIAEKVLRSKLSDSENQNALISRLLDEAEKSEELFN
ncbi:MAG: F0F1 ATP synthase subunit B [Tannerella sp.]|nr:F0F1 ATP synthase subunit B [Tannerella sp.]